MVLRVVSNVVAVKTQEVKNRHTMEFMQYVEDAARRRSLPETFNAFLLLSACTLSCGQRETEYMAEIGRWQADEIECFPKAFGALMLQMEAQPFTDILGGVYMDIQRGVQGRGGEFHTPQVLCEAIAQMLRVDDFPQEGVVKMAEPACGAGAMILAYAKQLTPEQRRRLRVDATDISLSACHMCFINTSLWAVPTTVYHGNALSGEVWSRWRNVAHCLP